MHNDAQKLPSEYVGYILGKYGPYRALLNEREEFEKYVDGRDLVTLLKSQRRYKVCSCVVA